jgi:hypothetical protein
MGYLHLPICQFDGYPCYRNLRCYSRFYSDVRCSRFVVVNSRFSRRKVKVVT